jgi:hypothetical protein
MNNAPKICGQVVRFSLQSFSFDVLNLWHSSGFPADYLVTKCGVLMMSLFVFFTTTMSVSFTLRETQTRMLKFTGLITSFFSVL